MTTTPKQSAEEEMMEKFKIASVGDNDDRSDVHEDLLEFCETLHKELKELRAKLSKYE